MADQSFIDEFLATHNAYRAKHGVPALTICEDLCSSAQSWADHLGSIKKLEHSKTKNGENIYSAWSSSPQKLTGKEAVDSWYSEVKDYDFSSPGFGYNTGHFTQVVWKGTTKLGVGMFSEGGDVYVVGQYNPAGNIVGTGNYEENVFPEAASGSGGEKGSSTPQSPKKSWCTLL